MNVYLTFDVEVWCGGWGRLDEAFPAAYERYIYGRSSHGDWGLPKTLEILNRHGLKGVFFVEPLFSARFGAEYLERIVCMLREGGQDVQLHLHPEWTDEIRPALIPDSSQKRQHLNYYTLEEQTALIGHGRRMLEAAGSGEIKVFRAGSYAANGDTLEALRCNDILIDSSPNRWYTISAPDMRQHHNFRAPFVHQNVSVYPVAIFRDGFGRDRPAQVNGASFEELRGALSTAHNLGQRDFVIVSHSFEMLKFARSEPDSFVVRRFERLCAFLENQRDQMNVGAYAPLKAAEESDERRPSPKASFGATTVRYGEQILRRFF